MVFCFASFGGSRWLRASEGVLIIVEEGGEALLCPTASLGCYGFDFWGLFDAGSHPEPEKSIRCYQLDMMK